MAAVSFQWKNPDFLLKNPDFLIRNLDFLLKNDDLYNETGKDATMLNKISGIAQAGQLSNMAAFVPTDCPTREKQ